MKPAVNLARGIITACSLLFVCVAACTSHQDCPGGCAYGAEATLQLTCTAPVISAELTGPCAPTGDAALFLVDAPDANHGGSGPAYAPGYGFSCAPITKVPFAECTYVYFTATGPGTCHVSLTFEGGYNFSTDVQWTEEVMGCGCPNLLVPSQGTIAVDNPSTTCVDAGVDAAADGPSDAAAVCPDAASEFVACAAPGNCTGCRLNTGFECTCAEAEAGADGGLEWQCIDTGFPCTEGSP